AAVLLVEEERIEVVLAVELDDVPGELVRGVDLGCTRRNAFPRDRPHQLVELLLLVCQGRQPHRSSFVSARGGTAWQSRGTRRVAGDGVSLDVNDGNWTLVTPPPGRLIRFAPRP